MINPDELQMRRASVEDIDLEKGLVEVRFMKYETEAELEPGLSEVFTRGAFAAAAKNPSRVKISDQGHQMRVVIGQAIELNDDGETLNGRLKISDTSAGRDVLTLLRDGVLTDLCVEFKPQKRYMKVERRTSGLLVRHDKATLIGISPVGSGAYADASRVLSVRDAEADLARERALARLHSLTAGPRA